MTSPPQACPRPTRTAASAEPHARPADALRARLSAPVAEHARSRSHLDTGEW
ncbi:hypothetical protein ACPXCS_31335 [Streptomyces sp. DT190]|uniref:hypothetical protein n=1 Tax=unclassified Streptomyces TaxID=2593676 RepID=UPI003CF920E0